MALLTSKTQITTPADGDWLHVVDVSDTTATSDGTSKKITRSDFLGDLDDITASTADLNATTNFEQTLSSSTTVLTVTDGTIDFNIASHDGTNGLKLAGTLVTSSAAELNLVDGKALSGSDASIITGTKGTSADLAIWNADGDLVDGPTPPSGTIVGTSDTQNLSNKTFTDQTEFSEDINLATGKNVQVNDADPDMIIELPAPAWTPTTTSGCADVTTVEAGTNDIDYNVLDFDASSDENAFCNFQMPTNYDGGVVQFRYVWTNAGGGAAEVLVLELSGRAYADNDAIDQAVGTAVELADTWIAQGDVHISAWSGDVTLAGTPAGGQWVHLEIMRDVAGGGTSDTLTGDARLIGVQIKYKIAQYGN
ncbi:MAG: hypothetical protein GY861_03210 [bacterium]|nr:hypothetical protein [bacterium]